MFTLTDTAVEKIDSILREMTHGQRAVRVTANSDSPFHIEYGIQPIFDDDISRDDKRIDFDTFTIFISSKEYPLLANVILDYKTSGDESGFSFSSPKKETDNFQGTFAQKVLHVVNTQINPTIAQHGGIISIVDIRGYDVYVEMGGNCQGCSLSFITLKNGVINGLKEAIPEIGEVIDATDHEAGATPYYS